MDRPGDLDTTVSWDARNAPAPQPRPGADDRKGVAMNDTTDETTNRILSMGAIPGLDYAVTLPRDFDPAARAAGREPPLPGFPCEIVPGWVPESNDDPEHWVWTAAVDGVEPP